MGTIARFFNIPQASSNFWLNLNTQNMTDPTIVSPVKMEYGWNFSLSGLKIMMKSGLEKMFVKFLHGHVIFIAEFVLFTKTPPFYEVNSFYKKWWSHGGILNIFFLDHFSPSFLSQKCQNFTHIPFWPGTQWSDLSYSVC